MRARGRATLAARRSRPAVTSTSIPGVYAAGARRTASPGAPRPPCGRAGQRIAFGEHLPALGVVGTRTIGRMGSLKKKAAVALGLFLALAPPGTMIGLALGAAWLARRHPLLSGALAVLAAAGAVAAWRGLRRRKSGARG